MKLVLSRSPARTMVIMSVKARDDPTVRRLGSPGIRRRATVGAEYSAPAFWIRGARLGPQVAVGFAAGSPGEGLYSPFVAWGTGLAV